VFVGGKFIGGGTETDELHKSGKLTEILKTNNII
jgi:glutaredoxin